MSTIPQTLFALWTGDNPMPKRREEALYSLKNTKLEVILITQKNLSTFVSKSAPLHPAYPYLSAIHRADYLRAYLMHHYGGGYSDIKFTQTSWLGSFQKLCDSDFLCSGYEEIGWRGVAHVRSCFLYFRLLWHRKQLIGNCAYIFKRKTLFTESWMRRVNRELDRLMPALVKNRARHPEDFLNRNLNGSLSLYPIRWTQLLGDIFHPLCLKHRSEIDRSLPRPLFHETVDF